MNHVTRDMITGHLAMHLLLPAGEVDKSHTRWVLDSKKTALVPPDAIVKAELLLRECGMGSSHHFRQSAQQHKRIMRLLAAIGPGDISKEDVSDEDGSDADDGDAASEGAASQDAASKDAESEDAASEDAAAAEAPHAFSE